MNLSFNVILPIIISFILFFYSDLISSKLNLVDYPDKVRKKHKFPVPKTGGIVVYISIILFLLLQNKFYENVNFIVFITFFLFLGLIDDVKNLSSTNRLVFSFIFIVIFLLINSELRVNNLKIFNRDLNLESYFGFSTNILFTTLCILLIQNAINMIDGINTICASFIIFCIFLFNIKYNYSEVEIILILNLIIFIFFNYKSKIFLGNSGSYLVSSILAYKILYNNNIYYNLSGEEIFLILMIPGIDMLRLFIFRITNKKNPFSGDNNHIHHLLLKFHKNNNDLTILSTLLILFTPGLLSLFTNIEKIILIIIVLVFYFILIFKIKK